MRDDELLPDRTFMRSRSDDPEEEVDDALDDEACDAAVDGREMYGWGDGRSRDSEARLEVRLAIDR